MTTKRGSIHFAIPLPVAVDPASLERLTKVITDTHAAIGAFTAAIASLGGSAAYRPKGERRVGSAAPEPPRPSGTGPAPPITDAGRSVTDVVDAFDVGKFARTKG